ncbi:MAG: BspA family leucine-rich repeat surface protein, partial [Pseudomonadota bacterium]
MTSSAVYQWSNFWRFSGALGQVFLAVAHYLACSSQAFAQTNLIGLSATSGALVGYAVSQNKEAVTVESIGQLTPNREVGHLYGSFSRRNAKELLKVRQVSDDTFHFSATTAGGRDIERRFRVSLPVGEFYYLVTGFDLDRNGIHDLAIVDATKHRLRWFIIHNPLTRDAREVSSFILGFYGDRVEWTYSPKREVVFAAIRQTPYSPRVRALLRNAGTGERVIKRARWEDASGLLAPVRIKDSHRYDPGIALYSPAKRLILMFNAQGGFDRYDLPAQRCEGTQAIRNVTSQGAVSALELCADGAFYIAERAKDQGQVGDALVATGALPEAITKVRNALITRVGKETGEAPLVLPVPGSDGSEILDPSPSNPNRVLTPTPTPTAQPTNTPQPTATPTETPTPTPTTIPTPMVFTIDTTQVSTGSTGSSSFELPLVPGGEYNFTVYWGDGSSDVITAYEDASRTHTYSSPGTYTVTIYGQLYGWRFDNNGDRLKLGDISQWGNKFRFVSSGGAAPSSYALASSEGEIEALTVAGGYVWAGTNTAPGKLIRYNPTAGTHETTSLQAGEDYIYGMTSDGTSVYAVDWDVASNIIRFDAASGARIAAYPTGVGNLFSMTFDGAYVWAASDGAAAKLVRFDPATAQIDVYDLTGATGGWSIVSVGEFIYGVSGTGLFRFNKASLTTDTVTITGASGAKGIAFDGANLWVTTDQNPMRLIKVDPNVLTYEVMTMPSGIRSSEGLAFDGTHLWSTLKNADVSSLLKIPVADTGAATTVPLSGTANATQAIAFDGSKVWAASYAAPSSIFGIGKSYWPSDGYFYGCSNMTVSASDAPDMTGTTSMANAFRDCTDFNSDIGHWDVSQVQSFRSTFRNATSFSNGAGLHVEPYDYYWASTSAQLYVSSGVYNGLRLKAIVPTDNSLYYYYHGRSVTTASNSGGKLMLIYGADFPNLTRVRVSTTGTLPGGLSPNTDYWIIRQPYAANGDRRPAALLATSLADAEAGISISYTNVGTGVHTIVDASDQGWQASSAHNQYWTKHYDDGTEMRPVTNDYWSVRWFYREISASNKRIYYVSGIGEYATQTAAEVEAERTDLPSKITNDCVLVAKIIVKRHSGSDTATNLQYALTSLVSPSGYYGGSNSIANWDVSRATSLERMFAGAIAFNQDVGSWDVGSVTSFRSIFSSTSAFNQNLSSWNTENGIDFAGVFNAALTFNNGDSGNNGAKPLTWNVSKGSYFDWAFASNPKFNQNLSSWDMRNATTIYYMFGYTPLFNNGDTTNAQSKPLTWYLPKVTNASQVFYGGANAFNQDISSWFTPQNGDVMQVKQLAYGLCNQQNGRTSGFNNGGSPNINNWRTPNLTNLYGIFCECTSFNQPIGDWDVSAVTSLTSTFHNATAFNQDLSAWNTGNVTRMDGVFTGATSFNNGDPGNNGAKPLPWNTSNATTLSGMFYWASSFNQDISSWDTSSSTSMANMFYNAGIFNNGEISDTASRPLAWTGTSAVTNME